MTAEDWLLTAGERGNPSTGLDRRRPDGLAWSRGNAVQFLVHGDSYFAELRRCVEAMRADDLLMFTDWRGDPDELLDGPGSEVSRVLSRAAARGVLVRGLVWRSHLDKLTFSEQENRHLGEEIEAAGGVCLLDMRVRPGGSHHQKFVVLRHPGRPELDVAFVGGIDLCHSRRDGALHHGDRQRQPMAAVYGSAPPWHDVQVALRGPAVGDVEFTFRERWQDPAPLSRNPVHRLRDARIDAGGPDPVRRRLPPQLADPPPCGEHTVQLLRTYPGRRPGYPFARQGERSVARGITKVIGRASRLIYLEDQYLWSVDAALRLRDTLRDRPRLQLIAVIPRFPDQDGRLSTPPNLVSRRQLLRMLQAAAPGRVACYGVENHAGVPVYVHAKVCIVDDTWVSVGSDNINRRSWSHDSELSCAIVAGQSDLPSAARELRLELAREHLDAPGASLEGSEMFDAFAACAAALDGWHAAGRRGPRPAGRLRRYPVPVLSAPQAALAALLYRVVYDPDGRPRALRRAHEY